MNLYSGKTRAPVVEIFPLIGARNDKGITAEIQIRSPGKKGIPRQRVIRRKYRYYL